MKALFADDVHETDCCGLFEVVGLKIREPDEPVALLDYLQYHEDRTLKQVIADEADGPYAGGRAFFATTIPNQKKEIKGLKRLGFKRALRWKNSNTGNTVTLWIKIQSKKRQRKRRKK